MEHAWLPRLAPLLPLAIPVPLATGEPAEGYPWRWSIVPWLEGETATIERIADLQSGNLLAVDGRLTAVIDFGCLGVGDPACDLIVAWNLLSAGTRDPFRTALLVDDATCVRGRGWALSVGLIALPYYRHTNPVLAGIARHSIAEVLADHS